MRFEEQERAGNSPSSAEQSRDEPVEAPFDPGGSPAKHSAASFLDKEAVSHIEGILAKHRRVKPNLTSGDTWPNTDGFLELVDSKGRPYARLEAQVKTLPSPFEGTYHCNRKFLDYCWTHIEVPILLLGYDRDARSVYWLHVDRSLLRDLNYDEDPGGENAASFKQAEL